MASKHELLCVQLMQFVTIPSNHWTNIEIALDCVQFIDGTLPRGLLARKLVAKDKGLEKWNVSIMLAVELPMFFVPTISDPKKVKIARIGQVAISFGGQANGPR